MFAGGLVPVLSPDALVRYENEVFVQANLNYLTFTQFKPVGSVVRYLTCIALRYHSQETNVASYYVLGPHPEIVCDWSSLDIRAIPMITKFQILEHHYCLWARDSYQTA